MITSEGKYSQFAWLFAAVPDVLIMPQSIFYSDKAFFMALAIAWREKGF